MAGYNTTKASQKCEAFVLSGKRDSNADVSVSILTFLTFSVRERQGSRPRLCIF